MLNYRKLFRLHATGKTPEEVAEAVGCPTYIVNGAVIRSEEINLQWPVDPSQSNNDIEAMLYKSKARDKNSLDNQYMDVANESLAVCGISPCAQAWKSMSFDDHCEAEKDLVNIRDNNKENSEIFRASGDALFFLNYYLISSECARRTKGKWGGTYSDKLQSALTDIWDECSHKWRYYKADVPYVMYMLPDTPEAAQEKEKLKKSKAAKNATKKEETFTLKEVMAPLYDVLEIFYGKNLLKVHKASKFEIDAAKEMYKLYSQDVILLAAKECKRVNGNICDNICDTLKLLKSWKNKGLEKKEDIEDYIRKFHNQTNLLRVLYNRWNISGKISQEHRNMADEWQNKLGFSNNAIIEAATQIKEHDVLGRNIGKNAKLKQLHALLKKMNNVYEKSDDHTIVQIENINSSDIENKLDATNAENLQVSELDPVAVFETLTEDHQNIVINVAKALSENKLYVQKA